MSNRLSAAKLLEFRVSLPANLEGDLERRFATNAQRSLRLTRELARIMACLENHSVDAIPYKGPALAQAIYGDVAMRQFSDLDILIRVSDYDRADRSLCKSWDMNRPPNYARRLNVHG
jgi:hypothetical protein